ncbi:hypothetical protein [Pseudomonas sp.]|uniref:hypothetical protein n=1 Tax=Pseudomonas sp. TaxID=306 RepID=UPI003FD6F171
MKVNQIYALVNQATNEMLGESAVLAEDLSNIVDIGKAVINTDNVDNYVKKLVNHIGKVVFVNRAYSGGVPSVLMDSWEFGSILEKVSADIPEASENDTWSLVDGQDYSPNKFYQPSVSAKFFNSKVTFEIPMSFTEKQVKESFSSAEQLNGFLSMLVTAVENSMTVKLDALIMRTMTNFIGEVLGGATPGIRSVNLLTGFNAAFPAADLTAAGALVSPDFIRYATMQIKMYSDRMERISTLFNAGGKERFTSRDLQHVVLLSEFAAAASTYLLSDTYNKDDVTLIDHETVPYWQGSGTTYSFEDTSSINVKTASGKTVDASGIIGIIFDRDALGVTNLDRRVTTNYNARAEFYTNFYKFDAGYYNDLDENFVVFHVADPVTP